MRDLTVTVNVPIVVDLVCTTVKYGNSCKSQFSVEHTISSALTSALEQTPFWQELLAR